VSAAPPRSAAALLRAACTLGLVGAALTVGDTMATVARITANRTALEHDYAAGSGASAEQAHVVIGGSIAGGFLMGLVLAAAVAALAVLALRAGRGVRAGLVVCALLALPGAFSGLWALGRAVALVAALGCVFAPPAAAAFEQRRTAATDATTGR
jgi:hypothetical protein